jgi:hypothetical protein
MLQPLAVFGPWPSLTQVPVPLGPVIPAVPRATVPNVPPEVICSEKELNTSAIETLVPLTVISTKNPPEPSEPPEVKVNVTPPVARQFVFDAQVSALATPVNPQQMSAISAPKIKAFFILDSLWAKKHTYAGTHASWSHSISSMYCTKVQVAPLFLPWSYLLKIKHLVFDTFHFADPQARMCKCLPFLRILLCNLRLRQSTATTSSTQFYDQHPQKRIDRL